MRVVTTTIAGLALLMLTLAATANPGLVAIAESSSMIWNAIAVLDEDIYVAASAGRVRKGLRLPASMRRMT